MIQKMSHTTLFVLDQDAALDFYVNKLGFEVKTNASMGEDMKWITVSPPGQPDLEIVLMACKVNAMLDEDTASHIRWLLENGKMGAGVFSTPDCRKTYAELKAKGVEFISEPTEQFYGIEAIFKDGCGNWFSLGQEKPH